MKDLHQTTSVPAQQQGIALLTVLLLLVVMSVLGIAVLRSSAMQERMAANLRDRSLAMQAAEIALAKAQSDFAAMTKFRTTPPTAACDTGVCPSTTKKADAAWVSGPATGGVAGIPKTTTQYWIQYLGENQSAMETGGVVPASETTATGPTYRITAQATTLGGGSVTLQSDVIYRQGRL